MKYFISILLSIAFLLPLQSTANVKSEEEQIKNLFAQVEILIREVERLQKLLNEPGIKEDAFAALPPIEMQNIIESSVDWFKAAQEESGHFAYEYLPYENRYLPLDNIVRQAGGLYALGEVAIRDTENKHDLKSTLLQGIRYFDSLSHQGDWNGYTFRCIGNSSINHSCQLGATSLALVGLTDAVTRYPELKETYDDLIHNYGRYILAMKKDVGGFRHAYSAGSAPSENESSFSNGEALLALVRYYIYMPQEEVREVIDDTFVYFDSPEVAFDFPLYLWVTAAVKDMQRLWPNPKYVDYVDRYTTWRLNGFAHRKLSDHNMCAYVEGVISAYSVLEGSATDVRLNTLQREINYWLRRSALLQISEEDTHRIITDENGTRFGTIAQIEKAKGGFLTDQNELTQRIDFTQHCLNSYVQQLVDIDGEDL